MRLVCRIAEARHPVIGVVHRMVDAVRPGAPDATRRNTEMMIEAGEVRATTQIAERQRGRITVVRLQPDVVDGARAHRIGHDTSHCAEQRLERWGSGAAEVRAGEGAILIDVRHEDRKSTRLNSSHLVISYAVFCLKKKKNKIS